MSINNTQINSVEENPSYWSYLNPLNAADYVLSTTAEVVGTVAGAMLGYGEFAINEIADSPLPGLVTTTVNATTQAVGAVAGYVIGTEIEGALDNAFDSTALQRPDKPGILSMIEEGDIKAAATRVVNDATNATVEQVIASDIVKENIIEYGAQLLDGVNQLQENITKVATASEIDPAIQEKVNHFIKILTPIATDVLIPMLEKTEQLEAERNNISLSTLRNNKAKELGSYFTPDKIFPGKNSLNEVINGMIDDLENDSFIGRMINKPSRLARDNIYLSNLKSNLEKFSSDKQNITSLGIVINNKIATMINALANLDSTSTEEDLIKQLGITTSLKQYKKEANQRIEDNVKQLVIDKPNDSLWSFNLFKVVYRFIKIIFNTIRSTILNALFRVYVGNTHLTDALLSKMTPQIQSKLFEYLKINGEIEKYNKFSPLLGKYMIDAVLQELAETTSATLQAKVNQTPIVPKFADDKAANEALNASINNILESLKKTAEKNKDSIPTMSLASNALAKLGEVYLSTPEGEDNPLQTVYQTVLPKWTEWLKA